MRIPHLRLAWTAAVGILAAWFSQRNDLTATDVPTVVGAAIVAYLVWPAFAARLPPGYVMALTPGGGVVAVLLGLMYALLPVTGAMPAERCARREKRVRYRLDGSQGACTRRGIAEVGSDMTERHLTRRWGA